MIDASFNFLPTRPASEIVAEYIRTVDYLYKPTKYLARAYRYYLAMRPTRCRRREEQEPGHTASRKAVCRSMPGARI